MPALTEHMQDRRVLLGLEKRRIRGSHQCVNTWREGATRREPASFWWCPVTDQRQWPQGETWELLYEHQETLYCEGGWVLAQVAQRGGGVSILGDIQKSSGYGPGQLDLADLAISREVGLGSVQTSLPTSTVLRSRDSVGFCQQFRGGRRACCQRAEGHCSSCWACAEQ